MASQANELPIKDGYRGIWHGQPGAEPYKYSGGLGTYPQQMNPLAVYDQVSDRTYFVFGARARDPHPGQGVGDGNSLQIHLGYFDHATGMVGRPRVVMSKAQAGTNPHENATLAIDDQGYLYVFVNSHGPSRNGDGTPYRADSFVFKSHAPRDVTAFSEIIGNTAVLDPATDTVDPLTDGKDDHALGTNFAYSQTWNVPGRGLMFLHTKYRDGWAGRDLKWMTSVDGGRTWSNRATLAAAEQGHYSVSSLHGQTVGVAFNHHPQAENFEGNRGLDARTNLYFVQTDDLGQTWTGADGSAYQPGATDLSGLSAALVHDYASENKLVYLKDLNYTAAGEPVLLYLTSDTAYPATDHRAPDVAVHTWHTARHDIDEGWIVRDVTTSDHNYDFGSLYIEDTGVWRLIAPTAAGPIADGTGGGMRMWVSSDEGASWEELRELAEGVGTSHTYARRPLYAQDDFYALWADGDPFVVSESHLYFTNREGTAVWRLPYRGIQDELNEPELVWVVPEPGAAALLAGGLAAGLSGRARRVNCVRD